jgi:hypothetical protein
MISPGGTYTPSRKTEPATSKSLDTCLRTGLTPFRRINIQLGLTEGPRAERTQLGSAATLHAVDLKLGGSNITNAEPHDSRLEEVDPLKPDFESRQVIWRVSNDQAVDAKQSHFSSRIIVRGFAKQARHAGITLAIITAIAGKSGAINHTR